MSISTEEKDRYLRETAIVLAREGFQTGKTDTGKLRVLLDGAPLCEVTENGGITYRNEDINEPERVAAKDMVYPTAQGILGFRHTANIDRFHFSDRGYLVSQLVPKDGNGLYRWRPRGCKQPASSVPCN